MGLPALLAASHVLLASTASAHFEVRGFSVAAQELVYDEGSGRIYVSTSRRRSNNRVVLIDTKSGNFPMLELGLPGNEILYDTYSETVYVISPKTGIWEADRDQSNETGFKIMGVSLADNSLTYEPTSGMIYMTGGAADVAETPLNLTSGGYEIREINLSTNDLIYDPTSSMIYASTPSSAGMLGNSIVPIDPITGGIGTAVFIGSEPGPVARSDDGQFLYVSLDGAFAVRRFNLTTQTAGLQFALGSDSFFGPYVAEDIEVQPGNPLVIAVSRKNLGISPRHAGVGIYDDGVVRSNTTQRHTGSNRIEFSDDPSLLYGYNNETTEFGFRKIAVDANGATETSVHQNFISGFGVDIEFHDGSVYSTSGVVLDPALPSVLGTYTGVFFANSVRADSTNGVVYFLTSNQILVYNLDTFIPLDAVTIPGISGTPGSLVQWGPDQLAFRTSGDQVFFVDGQADLSITKSDSADPVLQGSPFTYMLMVTNDGPAPGTGVSVTDALPSDLSFVSATPTQGSCTENSNTVTCEVGDLPVSTVASVSIVVTPIATGSIINTATVTASKTDPNPTNNSVMEMTNVDPAADLSITKDNGQTEVNPGDPVSYTLSVANAGPSDAFGAAVMDTFPLELSACSWTCSGSGGATCTVGPVVGNISDNVDIPVGGSLTYTVNCTIDPAATGTVANTGTILAPVTVVDPNPNNDSSTDTDVVLGPCGFPNERVLENLIIDSTQVFQACNTITAGPGFQVLGGGNVTLRAGQSIILANGCSFDGGANLTVEIDPLLASN